MNENTKPPTTRRAEASAARFYEVLDRKPRIRHADQPYRGHEGAKPAVEGRVVFDRASFHYELTEVATTNGFHPEGQVTKTSNDCRGDACRPLDPIGV